MKAPDPREAPEGIALVGGILDRVGWPLSAMLLPLGSARAELYDWRRAADPERFAAAQQMARASTDTFEVCWEYLARPKPAGDRAGYQITVSIFDEIHHFQAPDPRQRALAAKARQGKGPPSSSSWRGRERTTKFRSQQ